MPEEKQPSDLVQQKDGLSKKQAVGNYEPKLRYMTLFFYVSEITKTDVAQFLQISAEQINAFSCHTDEKPGKDHSLCDVYLTDQNGENNDGEIAL